LEGADTTILFISFYILMCLDATITTFGVLSGLGAEGNPLLNWVNPPVMQVLFIAGATITGGWVSFGIFYHMGPKAQEYRMVFNYVLVAACLIRVMSISTWLIGAPPA
jgi:hypothetical protein